MLLDAGAIEWKMGFVNVLTITKLVLFSALLRITQVVALIVFRSDLVRTNVVLAEKTSPNFNPESVR